jgi:hypothetical protein
MGTLRLIDDVHKKTQLLDTAEYENLRYMQKQRHLCAHPILNSERELHSPKQETVRSLLRNTLEELLLKPPFYTQRIMRELLEDISESAAVLNTRKKVKKYVESKYFSRTTPTVELNIFRSMWKLVFKLENENCNKNRTINLHVLEVLSSRNIGRLPETINGDKDYYSNISPTGIPLSFLVFFLSKNSSLFPLFSDDARLKIEHCIENDPIGKTIGWFVKSSLETHANDLEAWIKSAEHPSFTPDQFDVVLQISDSDEWQERFCELVSTYYAASHNYDQADSRFKESIPKHINLFNKASIIYLATLIENNGQCYSRGKARQDYEIIKSRIDVLFGKEFNYEALPFFRRKVVMTE